MKRDWKIIKVVLEELESLNSSNSITLSIYSTGDKKSTDEEINKFYMASLLLEQNYIKGLPSKSLNTDYKSISDLNLTWKGHDLLDTLNDNKVWNKIKEIALNKGIDITFSTFEPLKNAALASILT